MGGNVNEGLGRLQHGRSAYKQIQCPGHVARKPMSSLWMSKHGVQLSVPLLRQPRWSTLYPMSMRLLAVAATLLAVSSLSSSCASQVNSATSNPTPSRTSVSSSTPPSASASKQAHCEPPHERIRLVAQGSNTTVVIAPIVTDSTGRRCAVEGHILRLSLVDPAGRPLRVDGAPAIAKLAISQGANRFDWSNWCGPHVVVTIVGQLDPGGGGPKIALTSPYLPACLAPSSRSRLNVIAN